MSVTSYSYGMDLFTDGRIFDILAALFVVIGSGAVVFVALRAYGSYLEPPNPVAGRAHRELERSQG